MREKVEEKEASTERRKRNGCLHRAGTTTAHVNKVAASLLCFLLPLSLPSYSRLSLHPRTYVHPGRQAYGNGSRQPDSGVDNTKKI